MTELKVTGMTCSHCQHAVKDALKSVDGVQNVEVDLASGTAYIEGNANINALITAVEEEGYQAAPLNR